MSVLVAPHLECDVIKWNFRCKEIWGDSKDKASNTHARRYTHGQMVLFTTWRCVWDHFPVKMQRNLKYKEIEFLTYVYDIIPCINNVKSNIKHNE